MPSNYFEEFERDGTKAGDMTEGALTIHELWRCLKGCKLLPKNTPILDFFYLLFPEVVLQQEEEVYSEVTVAKRRTVFSRSNKYVKLTGSEEGKRFYESFTGLVLSYYGDIYAWCDRLLEQLIVNALRPEQRTSISAEQLLHYKKNPPIQVKEFFAEAENYMEEEQIGLLPILLYGTGKPASAIEQDYAMELTAIAVAAIYGPVVLEHFENRPFVALPRIQTFIKSPAHTEGDTQEPAEEGSQTATSSHTKEEEIEARRSRLQKDFKNNELTEFYRKWTSPPFLHRKSNPPLSLEQLYLPPDITLPLRSNTDITENMNATLSGKELLEFFFHPWTDDEGPNLFYITGQPGIGKTSFLAYMTGEILQSYYDSFAKLYQRLLVISFKHLNREDLKGGLFHAIKKHTGCIDDSDYGQTLLILDGFDEIRISDAGKRAKLIEEFVGQMSDLRDRAEGLCCILTSRDGYLPKSGEGAWGSIRNRSRHSAPFDKDMEEPREIPVFHLEHFDYQKIQDYNTQYNKACQEQRVPMPEFPKETRDKDCEIYGIPIILYMVHGTGLNVSSIADKNELYDRLFSTRNGQIYAKRDTASGEAKYQKEMILCYDAVACELAYRMFELGTGPAIQTIEERERLWEKRIAPHLTRLLEERLEGNEQIAGCIASVKDSYVSFNYYYEGTHEEISDLEFVHKSIYEYYAGLYISRQLYGFIRLLSRPDMKEGRDRQSVLHAFAQQITALFCHQSLTDEIRAALEYHLQKHFSAEDRKQKNKNGFLQRGRQETLPGFREAYEQFHAGLQQLFTDGIGNHLFLLAQNTKENLLHMFSIQAGVSGYSETDCAALEKSAKQYSYTGMLSYVPSGRYENIETWRYVPKDIGINLQLLHDTHQSVFCAFPNSIALASVMGRIMEEVLILDYYFYTKGYPDEQERLQYKRSFGQDGHGFDLALRQASTHERNSMRLFGTFTHSHIKTLSLELSDAIVENCCFSGVDFQLTKLKHTVFRNCSMQGVNMADLNLQHTYFENTDLTGANFRGCEFSPDVHTTNGSEEERKHFSKCNLARANFAYANLSGVDLSTCEEMQSAAFVHSNISGVRIRNKEFEAQGTAYGRGFPVFSSFEAWNYREGRYTDCFPAVDWTACNTPAMIEHGAANLHEDGCSAADCFPVNRFYTYNSALNRYLFPEGERILGSSIYFGRYPQNRDGADMDSGVAWQVIGLEEAEGRIYALLFAELVLDWQPYFASTIKYFNWKRSSLYQYMNGTMLNRMFTEEEQIFIADRGEGKLFLFDPVYMTPGSGELAQALPELMMVHSSAYAKYLKECHESSREQEFGSAAIMATDSHWAGEDYWTAPVYDALQYLHLLVTENWNSDQYDASLQQYFKGLGLTDSEISKVFTGAEPKAAFLSYVRHKGFHIIPPYTSEGPSNPVRGVRPVMWLDVTHLF